MFIAGYDEPDTGVLKRYRQLFPVLTEPDDRLPQPLGYFRNDPGLELSAAEVCLHIVC
jgi:hypothetical protein